MLSLCPHQFASPQSLCFQGSYQHRPSHLNMFMTKSEEDDPRNRNKYTELIQGVMEGTWTYPDSYWAFLLCSGMTLMSCQPSAKGKVFNEVLIQHSTSSDNGHVYAVSGSMCLVRWFHRVHPLADIRRELATKTKKRVCERRLAAICAKIDPLAERMGCDRLVWARKSDRNEATGTGVMTRTIKQKLGCFSTMKWPSARRSLEITMPTLPPAALLQFAARWTRSAKVDTGLMTYTKAKRTVICSQS